MAVVVTMAEEKDWKGFFFLPAVDWWWWWWWLWLGLGWWLWPGLSIPYRTGRYGRNIPYQPAIRYIRPPLFHTGKNTGRTGCTGQFRAILAGTRRIGRYRKQFFFFFFFLSFVIFEFLLGQNGNLFVLTYQYYLFSQYAIVTFKLSILFFYFFSHLIDTKV